MIAVADGQWAAASLIGIVLKEGDNRKNLDFQLNKGTLIHGTITVETDKKPWLTGPLYDLSITQYGPEIPNEWKSSPLSFSWEEGPDRYRVRLDRHADVDATGHYAFRVGPGEYELDFPSPLESKRLTVTNQREIVIDSPLPELPVWAPALERLPENLKFTPPDHGEDAASLVERVLAANKPWIEPKPVAATYSLSGNAHLEKETLGPFSVSKGCKAAVRVGSIVRTPLHSMLNKEKPYTLRMVGKANWKGKNLVAVDVAFKEWVRNEVGLGGQADASYSFCEYGVATARIVIEPANAVPLFIDSWSPLVPEMAVEPEMDHRFHATWAFGPDFFQVDGGFAPKMFEWVDVDFRERQQFQVASGVWIFKQGDAWWGAANPFARSGHIQKLELRDLRITMGRP